MFRVIWDINLMSPNMPSFRRLCARLIQGQIRPPGLSQYLDVMLKHGFDDLETLTDVQDRELL